MQVAPWNHMYHLLQINEQSQRRVRRGIDASVKDIKEQLADSFVQYQTTPSLFKSLSRQFCREGGVALVRADGQSTMAFPQNIRVLHCNNQSLVSQPGCYGEETYRRTVEETEHLEALVMWPVKSIVRHISLSYRTESTMIVPRS